MKHLFICLALIVGFTPKTSQAKQPDRWIVFGAAQNKDHVRLIHGLFDCPKGFQGVYIRKKSVRGGTWKPVNKTPLFPAALPDIKWNSIDPDKAEQKRLAALAQKMSADLDLRIAYRDRKRMARCTASPKELMDMLRLVYNDNLDESTFDLALICNLGCIDRQFQPDKPQIYGLFPVINGKVSQKPVHTIRLPIVAPFKLANASAKNEDGKLKLSWTVPRKICKAHSVYNFRIFAATNGAKTNAKPIGDVSASNWETDDKSLKFSWEDDRKGLKLNRSHTYRIKPYTVLKTELKQSFTIKYNPKQKK